MAKIENIDKIANNMTSSELIHPGEMIKDEIMARGLTQKELARQMGVSYTVFNEILNGKRPVTTEYALLLEAALGTSANIWLGLQADYNMQVVKQDKSFMKKLEKIRKIAAFFWWHKTKDEKCNKQMMTFLEESHRQPFKHNG